MHTRFACLAGLLGWVAAVASCSVDASLTCGASCDDGSVDATTDTSGDVAIQDGTTQDVKDASQGGDAGTDANEAGPADSSCDAKSFCQGNNDCCNGVGRCTSGNRCAATCGAPQASCTGNNNSDSCCLGTVCTNGTCGSCRPAEAGCLDDFQCCSNNCGGSGCF